MSEDKAGVAPAVAGGVSTASWQAVRKRTLSQIQTTWQTPWIAALPMTEYDSKEQRLHDEIVECCSYIQPSKIERKARDLVISKVKDLINWSIGNGEICIFGSVAQNLDFATSDVDLVIHHRTVHDKGRKIHVLRQICGHVKRFGLANNAIVIAQAKVPILRFETAPAMGSIKFDISMNADDGLRATPVIARYIDDMPPLRHLILIIKGFLAVRDFNSPATGGLGSYALTCLVISFLQHNPYVRPMAELQRPMEQESLGQLLLDFFKYYYWCSYSLVTSYISVTKGRLFPKELKGWNNPRKPRALAIECLINPDNDIGAVVTKKDAIFAAFRDAHDTLQSYELSLTTGNMLGSIVGVSPETVQWRAHVSDLMATGSLQKELDAIKLPPHEVFHGLKKEKRPQQAVALSNRSNFGPALHPSGATSTTKRSRGGDPAIPTHCNGPASRPYRRCD